MSQDPLARLFRSASQGLPACGASFGAGIEGRLLAEYQKATREVLDSSWVSLTPILRWALGSAVAAIIVGGVLGIREIREESPYDQAAVPDTVLALGYYR